MIDPKTCNGFVGIIQLQSFLRGRPRKSAVEVIVFDDEGTVVHSSGRQPGEWVSKGLLVRQPVDWFYFGITFVAM